MTNSVEVKKLKNQITGSDILTGIIKEMYFLVSHGVDFL